MEERNISEKESIELISRMIRNTQRKMEQGTGTPMLIWGFATVLTTLVVWIAMRLTHNPNVNFLWFLIPIIGCIGMLLRKKRPKGIRTFIDKMIIYIWLVLGGTGFVISSLSMFSFMWPFPILFVIILIMGMGTVLTGLVIEYKSIVIGGIAAIVIGIIQYLVKDYDIEMLLFALAFVVMAIIPGFILNHRARKHV